LRNGFLYFVFDCRNLRNTQAGRDGNQSGESEESGEGEGDTSLGQ